jgi:hypothetical protein
MAQRPVYLPATSGPTLVKTKMIDFQWYPGMSLSQKQKSIASLHQQASDTLGIRRTLEVSSKSPEKLGVSLSAFNLMITTPKRRYSVECAYQSSKVFELGGPYTDILGKTSLEAKRDPRLKESGKLIKFAFYNTDWPLQPTTAFYDYLYINALLRNSQLHDELDQYEAFTDIEFNPSKSLNCQAYSVALYRSLKKRGLLEEACKSQELFLKLVSGYKVNNVRENETLQPTLL